MVTEKREQVPLPKLFEAVLPYQSTIYVTVLNIIQCIALGFWINEAKEIITKEAFTLAWASRSLVALGVILLIWHRYVSELQYLWPITWADTIFPFLIGLLESLLVFFTNSAATSLICFAWLVVFFQLIGSVAYRLAYWARSKEITERLYKEFYREYPQFAIHLINFLKNHDKYDSKYYLIYSGQSIFLIIVAFRFPNPYNEVILPGIYFGLIISGEVLANFQKSIKNDVFLGPYFR